MHDEKSLFDNDGGIMHTLRMLLNPYSKYVSLSKFIFNITGISIFFFYFQYAFFLLVRKVGSIFMEIWIIEVLVIVNYGIFIHTSITSTKSRIIKTVKTVSSMMVFLIFLTLTWLVFAFFSTLLTLKIFLLFITVYYGLNTTTFLWSKTKKGISQKSMRSIFLVLLILSATSILTIALAHIPRTITISTEQKSEIIFWCGSSQIPDEPEILEKCKKYNIAFMPTIRNKSVGREDYMQAYKRLIDYEINIYFAILGTSCSYAYLKNAREFPDTYRNIRDWFIAEGIMDSPYVTSFTVDAEPPQDDVVALQEKTLIEGLTDGIDNYPAKEERESAATYFREFTDMIRKDGKQCGIVQSTRFMDNVDGDGDISLFLNNIYSLPVSWNFSITMLYRTNRLGGNEQDQPISDFYAELLGKFYGAIIEGRMFTTSQLSFFQNVMLEENSNDNNIQESYIFVGNFRPEFRDTAYIKEKAYYRDVDICRYFGNDKIFLYDLSGFRSHYGWDSIFSLGLYASIPTEWEMTYDTYKSLTFSWFYTGLVLLDIFASLERDL